MKSLNNIFMALSDPTRREIVRLLRERDLTPSEMLEHIDATQPTLSHHLEILKRANLVEGIRNGQYIRYSLNMGVFEMAMEYLTKHIKRR